MPRGSNLDGKPGPGRPRGLENKMTRTIKDMVETALKKAGGAAYLQRQAIAEPAAFLALVGKLIPRDLHLNADERKKISVRIVLNDSATACSLSPTVEGEIGKASEPKALPAANEGEIETKVPS